MQPSTMTGLCHELWDYSICLFNALLPGWKILSSIPQFWEQGIQKPFSSLQVLHRTNNREENDFSQWVFGNNKFLASRDDIFQKKFFELLLDSWNHECAKSYVIQLSYVRLLVFWLWIPEYIVLDHMDKKFGMLSYTLNFAPEAPKLKLRK